jgi:AraC-like DNA-binding protein
LDGPELITAYALGPTTDLIERCGGWRTVERTFKAAQLPLHIIEDRRLFIPYRAQAALLEHAARAIGDTHFGARAALEFPFENLGTYGQYVMMAPTLLIALKRAVRALKYLTTSGQFGLELGPDQVRITYDSGIQGSVGWRHIHEASAILIIDVVRKFVGGYWKPIRVELDYSIGSPRSKLENILGVSVIYDQPLIGIVIETSCLDAKNSRINGTAGRITYSDLRQMVRVRPGKSPLATMREILRLRILDGLTDVDGTAEQMSMSVRSLQRHLNREGTSYREIVDYVKRERAAALLLETADEVGDIAIDLGYSSPAHFVRAFRRWTGETPTAFRQKRLTVGNLQHFLDASAQSRR